MILQALQHYYDRKSARGGELPPFGFETKRIEFIIVLASDGGLVNIDDARQPRGSTLVGRSYQVPQGVKKTSGIAANLLWDNPEYVLGLVQKGKPERTAAAHTAFVERIEQELGDLGDIGVRAVLGFLSQLDLAPLKSYPAWAELAESKGNITFQLQGDPDLVCQRSAVVERIRQTGRQGGATEICLVTGAPDQPLLTHPAIKGVWGAQSSGANIVSNNLSAFTSWGKRQGLNAPVGRKAGFAYTTALNHLLQDDSRQRLQLGDTAIVFWAQRENAIEDDLPDFLSEGGADDPDRRIGKIRDLYKSVDFGELSRDDENTPFYVLGLAPNSARLAVRFWKAGSVAEIRREIIRHFDDLAIARPSYEQPYPSLFRLLVNTASLGRAENIPPKLGGELLRAAITGTPYPHTLLQAAIRRTRADRTVNYFRAAIIKAYLNRRHRIRPLLDKEITVSLDTENPNIGYRLGRLFAVLERIQENAQPGINATIRDRYYGSASASPLSVFSTLLKLKNHHLAKMESTGLPRHFETLIGTIIDGIDRFPAQLPLNDQGLFAIGYYHQRQDFYTKKTTDDTQTQGEHHDGQD